MGIIKTGAVVIGAGPGGYVCGIKLSHLGIPTIVVDANHLGGVCLNVGCIPSKALITASKAYSKTRKMSTMGVMVDGARVDMKKMQQWKGGIVKKLTGGVGQLLKSNGAKVMMGRAKLLGGGKVEVTSADGKKDTIEAESIVIATGSRPIQIPGYEFDGTNVLDSTGALDLDEIPERMVVIGGGYIGLELGGVFARIGSKVSVVEMMDQLLPGFEKDLVRPVEKALKKEKVDVLLQHKALGYEKSKKGLLCHVEDKKGQKKSIECDKILVTVGRRPNSENLGLDAAGVEVDKRGFITIDNQCRTNVPGVYAIGDVAGGMMLAHKASKEAEVAAEVIAGKPAAMDVRCIPAIVFTDPEVATVGLSEAEAKEQGHSVSVGKYPFSALGRAMTTNETEGFVRVIVDKTTQEVLGAEIVGSAASDLIAEAGLGIEMAAFADDIGLTIHAHPSLAEGFMEATQAAVGHAIHVINK